MNELLIEKMTLMDWMVWFEKTYPDKVTDLPPEILALRDATKRVKSALVHTGKAS